jgi:hypothetical protein
MIVMEQWLRTMHQETEEKAAMVSRTHLGICAE